MTYYFISLSYVSSTFEWARYMAPYKCLIIIIIIIIIIITQHTVIDIVTPLQFDLFVKVCHST